MTYMLNFALSFEEKIHVKVNYIPVMFRFFATGKTHTSNTWNVVASMQADFHVRNITHLLTSGIMSRVSALSYFPRSIHAQVLLFA